MYSITPSIPSAKIHIASKDKGLAYNINSSFSSSPANSSSLYLKNISDLNLFITEIEVGSTNSGLWEIWSISSSSIPTGSTVTPTSLNLGSTLTASLTVLGSGSITGLVQDKSLGVI